MECGILIGWPARVFARRTAFFPTASAGIALLLWASAFVAIRYAGKEFSAGALSLGRLTVGTLVLGLLVVVRDRHLPARRYWPRLLLTGITWFAIYNLALNEGERHLDAGIAAIVVNVGPIFIALLAGVFLQEGFPRGIFWGGALGLIGVAIIGISSSTGAHADGVGIVLCLIAAVTYAIGVVSQKSILGPVSALQVTWAACMIGTVVCLPFIPMLVHDSMHASVASIALVVYMGAFPTAVAFTAWAYALKTTSAGRLGATTYLVPPMAIFMGWIFLGERPALLALAGGALCLGGVYVTRRS